MEWMKRDFTNNTDGLIRLLTFGIVICLVMVIWGLVHIGYNSFIWFGWLDAPVGLSEFGMLASFGLLSFPVERLVNPIHQAMINTYMSAYMMPIYLGVVYVLCQLRKVFVSIKIDGSLFTTVNQKRFKKLTMAINIVFIIHLTIQVLVGNMMRTYFDRNLPLVTAEGNAISFETTNFIPVVLAFIILGVISALLMLFNKGLELQLDNDAFI